MSELAFRPRSVGTDDASAVSDIGSGDAHISTLPALTFWGHALERAVDRLGASPSSGDKPAAALTEQGQHEVMQSSILSFRQARHLTYQNDISTFTFWSRALGRAVDRSGASPSSADMLEAAPTEQGQHEVMQSPILDFPRVRHLPHEKMSERFVALQEWEGYVVSIQKDTFTAVLRDVTAGADIEQEEAEFPRGDIADADAELLRLGAVFRWVIGYQTKTGTRRRISQVVFRRLPQWTKKEIQRASQEAAQLAVRIKWE